MNARLNEPDDLREGSRRAHKMLSRPPRPKRSSSLRRRGRRAFSWLNLRPLWESRNDLLAELLGDPTNALRERWMRWLGEDDPVIDAHATKSEVTFAVLGDPGEGDRSQEVVIPPLMSIQDECDFLVVCSDVVYPAGDVNQYGEKFYEPYSEWHKPLYALPGNHDWYDELEGFMFHLCGVDRPPKDFGTNPPRPLLWRSPRRRGEKAKQLRARRPRDSFQPGPYFVIDTGPVTVVCIDTGIKGDLDAEQGRWLERVSAEVRKPKILLTGKPLIVDGEYHPGAIESLNRTVDDIVRDPKHGYVAVIGGDIHNYQRYPVQEDGRTIQYIVAGGGGAFMHATHQIEKVDLGRTVEKDFRCFPLRGDSLFIYSQVLFRALRRLVFTAVGLAFGAVTLTGALVAGLVVTGASLPWGILAGMLVAPPLVGSAVLLKQVHASGAFGVFWLDKNALTRKQAAGWVEQELGEKSTLRDGEAPGPRASRLAEFINPRLKTTSNFIQAGFSVIFDFDQPPFYKHFLRLDANQDELTITCCAVIGVPEERKRPFIEERLKIDLATLRAGLEAA